MACAIVQPSSVDSSNLHSTVDATENYSLRVGELQFKTTNVPLNHSAARNKTIISRNESVQLVPNFEEFVAFLLASDVPQVRSVFMGQEGRLIQVFIVVDEYDFDVNEQIYDREECVMEVFDRLDFDFHITCQRSMSDPGLKKVL